MHSNSCDAISWRRLLVLWFPIPHTILLQRQLHYLDSEEIASLPWQLIKMPGWTLRVSLTLYFCPLLAHAKSCISNHSKRTLSLKSSIEFYQLICEFTKLLYEKSKSLNVREKLSSDKIQDNLSRMKNTHARLKIVRVTNFFLHTLCKENNSSKKVP